MAIIFALGLFIFIKEGIIKYMLLINQFVYFDERGSLALFLIKYIMIMLMFAVFGYTLISLTKSTKRRKKL